MVNYIVVFIGKLPAKQCRNLISIQVHHNYRTQPGVPLSDSERDGKAN